MNALRACGRQNDLFWAVDCQYLRARWSESVGVRLSDVPEDDQKGVPALNVAHAPMLRCCMRANQTAKGAIWRRWGSTAYRAPTGRRRQNESCAGKRIEICKKIEKKNGGKRNRNSKGHRSMATSKKRGREICQSRCDLRTNAAVRHVKRMIRLADGARKHINI